MDERRVNGYTKSAMFLPNTDNAIGSRLAEIDQAVQAHASESPSAAPIEGLWLTQTEAAEPPELLPFSPMVCLVTQGQKRVRLRGVDYDYRPGTYLVVGMHLPLLTSVVRTPCRGVTLALSPSEVNELVAFCSTGTRQRHPTALGVYDATLDLLDAIKRLTSLLDEPSSIPVLGAAVRREITYRLLLGPAGAMLQSLSANGKTHFAQIAAAQQLMAQNLDRPVSIQEFAAAAGMAEKTFFRHFRAITGTTPLQFHKLMRLERGRQMLLEGTSNVTRAAQEAGYSSIPQFTRDFQRRFGVTPGGLRVGPSERNGRVRRRQASGD